MRGVSLVLSHPGNAPFVQHAARAFAEAGLLSGFVTTFHYERDSSLGRLLRAALGLVMRDADRQLSRRQITDVPRQLIRSHPLPEIIRMAAMMGTNPITTDRVWEVTEKWFDRLVARHHLRGATAVYAYEHAALATFEAQKRQGGKCIYEMPTSHHRLTAELVQPEFLRFPKAETAYDIHLRKLAPRRNQRKDRELHLADLVVANSSFAKMSLVQAGVAAERIVVIPLGAPPASLSLPARARRPFIFLAAGNLTVQKGIPYLLEAWRRLAVGAGVELWLVGNMMVPSELLADLPGKVVTRPSVPRHELFEIFRQAGALVFPSLCEGFGMVLTEAMSQGLPVITTPNTGGGDLIEDGRNGLLVPIRNSERLAETMQWCLDHPVEMEAISRAARETAARWQWSDYRAALSAAVLRFLDESRAGQAQLSQKG
jgi:glycosyltransferase involved in cell wall biosynthesis